MVTGIGAGRAPITGALEFYSAAEGSFITGVANTEADTQVIHRTAGTFSNLYVRVSAHSGGVVTTVRLRKALANVTQVVTVTANTTGAFEDTTHSDVITAGNLLDYSVDTTAGSTCTFRVIAMTFDATSTTVTRCMTTLLQTNSQNSTSARYTNLIGKLLYTNATEANSKTRIQKAGTLSNYALYMGNASDSGTGKSRINGVDGTLVVSITTSAGLFEDTTHSDTISAGNDVNSIRTMTGTSTGINMPTVSMDFKDTTNGYAIHSNGNDAPVAVNQAVTTYYPVSGDLSTVTTEAFVKCLAKDSYTCSNLTINVTANTVTAASNLKFRKSGVDGTQVATITASTPGLYTDSTHSDTLASTDDMNYVLVNGAGGTSLSNSYMDMVYKPAAAAVTIAQTVYVEWEEA
ncbi:MAG TPA: hypothetical protein VLG09_05215 [Candidatus Saccharimonadales bacterium]|nr:hypothetical protein [Candidatus Saccharimonadales bacterium]